MADDIRSLTESALLALQLLAVVCGIALFALASIGLLLATFRVGLRGRVFALPFAGNDDRRVELTKLFVRRLTTIEQDWIALATAIESVRNEVNARSSADAPTGPTPEAPLTTHDALPKLDLPDKKMASVASPRTSGDELLRDVVHLGGVGAIENADLGVISLAGVSFSPGDILALLRAAPGAVARRRLEGAIITVAGGNFLFTVEYEERTLGGKRRRRTETTEVQGEAWLPAIEDLAYRLEKERVYLVRDRWRWRRLLRLGREDARSATVRRAVIEAESWPACRSFLLAYAAHLRHYRDGSADEREEALDFYDEALHFQPGFPRAAYNRGALLYNRYLPKANLAAIADLELATQTDDPSLKPLALAGLAMAHCQAIQRFQRPRDQHEPAARQSGLAAFAMAPELEEAAFARGWLHQIDEEWEEAVARYETVAELPGESGAQRRIRSFALNNAAWILLSGYTNDEDPLVRAERLLWRALQLYPNKVAYANLAELARLSERREDAIRLFEAALSLDPFYANALTELAVVEIELAAVAAQQGASQVSEAHFASAHEHADAAQQLAAEDPDFAKTLGETFQTAWEKAQPFRQPAKKKRAATRKSKAAS
jgi:tetratricopeptide (TPR) repeat protein